MIAGAVAVWGWLALRLFAILRAQTLWREASGGAWWAVAAALAMVLAVAWSPAGVEAVSGPGWLLGAGFEILLGAVIGALVSLPGEAALGAARQSALHLGVGRSPAFVALQLALAAALALALDLHRPLFTALRSCATRWPLGDPDAWRLDVDIASVTVVAHDCTLLALGLATPVLLTVAVVELALALAASRGALADLAGAARPWLVAAAALAALGAAWATYPEAWLRALPPV